MRSSNPSDWMWTQAFELMAEAERMHRQFFHLALSHEARPAWDPPVDVFEDEREIVIVVALPGVAPDRVNATIDAGTLIVRAESRRPIGDTPRAVRRLEIPYGYFERRIALPDGQVQAGTHELVDGCLILRLIKDELKTL